MNQAQTRNCVYEELPPPQPLACPPSCSPGNLFTILRLLAVIVFKIFLLEDFDVQICKGHLLKKCKGDN